VIECLRIWERREERPALAVKIKRSWLPEMRRNKEKRSMTDDQVVLVTLRSLANAVNEFPLGTFSSEVRKKHPHISDEAFEKHVATTEANGYTKVERGIDPTARIVRPTIRLTEAGITEADRHSVNV
jgi:hypothetical protein